MTAAKPYLLRAMHEWISDNGLTPYILVRTTHEGVDVPQAHVSDGRIVLNVSLHAVRGFEISNDSVHFNARFSGQARDVFVPMAAIEAIYARENQQGMVFNADDSFGPGAPPAGQPPTRPGAGGSPGHKPRLSVVK
ncbi:MAG: ClpXP protease specificity-enhancing factor [Gammaproteobacteria bacterium]|nr:ClpXP protease specificity-enhancing factor [Gammaproteobacteria bacterium]